MEDLLLSQQLNWIDFFEIALVLIALYFLLRFISRVLSAANFTGRIQQSFRNLVYYILLIYELIVILLLGTAFVLIHPAFHGLLLLILTIGGFSHIQNYISGRVVQFDQTITVGKQLKLHDNQGIIFHMGRLGIQIKTSQGSQFINYTNLNREGYLLLSGKEIGGFYHLNITPKEPEANNNHLHHLTDLMAGAPYLDWSHKVELIPSINEANQVNAKVLVKEESHLYDLITLINEWGYSCKILKK